VENTEKQKTQREADSNGFIGKLPREPKEIPGAGKIEVVINPSNAKHCLVHVRQYHFAAATVFGNLTQQQAEEFASVDLAKRSPAPSKSLINAVDEAKMVRTVQLEIFSILSCLARLGVKDVLNEGTAEKNGKVDNPAANYRTLRRRFRQLSEQVDRMQEELSKSVDLQDQFVFKWRLGQLMPELKKAKERMNSAEAERDTQLLGLRELIMTNKMTLHAGDDRTLNALASAAEDGTQESDVLQEKREDFVLTQCAKLRLPVAVVKFGGWHDWTSNIMEWNKEHPTEQFSLMVITPKSLLEESKKMKEQK